MNPDETEHGADAREPEPRGGGTDPDRGEPDEISLVRMVNVVLRHRRAILGAAAVGAILLAAVTLLAPASYTSRTAFTPQSDAAGLSNLAGLAQQFGVSVPTPEGSRSPQFYVELLRTRRLLAATVEAEYRVADGSDEARTGDLMTLFEVDEDEPGGRRLELAIEELRDRMTTGVGPETGVVSLSVTTRWPDLSRQIAGRMLDLVNRFNVETRQTQAAAERRFLDERVARAREELQAAEDSLRTFLEQNRSYQNSPGLRFEYERLQRRVTLQQQVYSTLAQSYEQARIEEVRNTPVITVVDPAEEPARPDRQSLILRGVLGLLLGGMAGVAWAFVRQFMRSARVREPDEYAELARLREDASDDARRLLERMTAPLRRMRGREDR